jgi:phage terminase small subunit
MPILDNPKHELFAPAVASGCSQDEAYVKAGYEQNSSNAARLNGNERVKTRIQELLGAVAQRFELTEEKILRDIDQIKTRCLQGEPVRDKEGNPTGEWKFDARTALEACKLEGMYLAMWKQKHEHSGKVTLEELVAGSVEKPKT